MEILPDSSLEKIKELQLTLSKFTHEIRNPITLVSSELQLLLSSHPEVAGYGEWEAIIENMEYIKELLKELSDYNNAGRLTLKPTKLDEYLQEIARAFRPSMDYLEIDFKAEISKDLPKLSIDRLKLRQALFNLLRNAQEAVVPAEGKILFRAQTGPSGKAAISITDNGIGMTLQQQQQIFSPFVTYKKGGTGLGLAIARQVAEAHGGTLTAASRPGQGSTFTLLLG